MDVFSAIKKRRSIRKFKRKPVEKKTIERLLELTTQAPSGKNLQPWRMVVLTGKEKEKLQEILLASVERLEQEGIKTGSCRNSIRAMKQAPVLIIFYNARPVYPGDLSSPNRYTWSVDIQSIGGAIQTMILAATGMGLGTLWICDIFYGEKDISSWLGIEHEMVGAVALGYADEEPEPRPRKSWQEVTEWP